MAVLSYGVYTNLTQNATDEAASVMQDMPSLTHLIHLPALYLSVTDLWPLLRRINDDDATEILQALDTFAGCIINARTERPPHPVIKAQQTKRLATRLLKAIHKKGRRLLPMETSEASDDFNVIVSNMNDCISNAHADSSLKLQEIPASPTDGDQNT